MALIRNAKGRKVGSGYSRLFGDNTLGHLMSRVQGAVIASGTELEKLIKEKVDLINDLDSFLRQEIMQEGIFVADKRKVKKCKTLDFAGAEHSSMHSFIAKNAQHLQYIVRAHFCCFNQDNKQAIIDGFKEKIAPEEAMTGKKFCQLLEIDYNEIVKYRSRQSPDNLDYFLSELVKIDSVKIWLEKFLAKLTREIG